MKITILQQDIVWANPEANCIAASEAIDKNPGSDIYVLPEMFSTGFATKPEGIAEEDCYSLNWMRKKAAEVNAAICGSVATKNGDKFYNRFYFVEPNGKVTTYDKHHLFTFAGEDKVFTPGRERPIIEFRGFKILPEICYDLRFPVWARNSGYGKKNHYHIIIYVANWPVSRQGAWETLLRARAIENQCYVVGVNRIGKDSGNEYAGGSLVIDPCGRTLAGCISGEVSSSTADIDIETLTELHKSFPVLDDAP